MLLVLMLATLFAILALPCLLIPDAVWRAFMAADDCDEEFSDANHVAARNPFRETKQPVCMAKLIMLRHKINQSSQKKRNMKSPPVVVPPQRTGRTLTRTPSNFRHHRSRSSSWFRHGKQRS